MVSLCDKFHEIKVVYPRKVQIEFLEPAIKN